MESLLYQVALIALKSGEIVLKYYGLEQFDLKTDASPITQADLEANAYITQQLQAISSYPICSEEAVLEYTQRKSLEYFWLIDPLDGTKDFLAKNNEFTINIALVHKNHPILGVVFTPAFGLLYMALQGFGSFKVQAESQKDSTGIITFSSTLQDLKANKMRLSGERFVCDSKLIACDSMFHSTKKTQAFIERYDLKVQKYGSSLKICALAEGKADLYPRFNGTSEWDIAACDVILAESGGVILDCKSKKPMEYNKESLRNNDFVAFAKTQVQGAIYQDFLVQDF